MTEQLREWSADRPGVRVMLGVAAITSGMAVAWLVSGSAAVLAGMAILLAAGNGYAKAYSP